MKFLKYCRKRFITIIHPILLIGDQRSIINMLANFNAGGIVMSGNALCLTQRRLTNDHYLELALRDAREVYKPPITLSRFWKKIDEYDDPDSHLDEILKWLDRQAEIGDYVVIEGDQRFTDRIRDYCKEHRLIPVTAVWEPSPAIRNL